MSDQHLIGTEGDDLLETAEGNDWLEGLGGNDTLTGNGGNDILDGGSGQDLMSGGAGDDSYFVDDVGDVVIENLGEGIDTVYSSVNRVLGANLEHLILLGAAQYGIGNELSNLIAGNDSYNDLEGGGGADSLYGHGGDDYLVGGEGDDYIDGGSGRDQMYGGAGDDLYIVDDGTDWILENDGEGVDTVQSFATTFQLAAHIENLTLFGAAASGVGNDGDNVIVGTDTDNGIYGLGGNDVLIGGGGNDYIADYGDGGNDQLIGGAGSDWLIGMGGNDVYDPGFGGGDTVWDTAGDDELRMGPGITPDQVERIRESGSNHLILRIAGTTDQVTLSNWFLDPSFQIERVVFDDATVWAPLDTQSLRYIGTAGDDVLGGSEYGEQLEGRGGNDNLFGGFGDDQYIHGPGFGQDYLLDTGGFDELRFGAGISPDQIERVFSGGTDLILRVAGTSDSVRLTYWFVDPRYQIERVVFDDGTVWTPEQMGGPIYHLGTAGDDVLVGTELSEFFEVLGGSDTLIGDAGDDLYVLDAGGHDWVHDSSGFDRIQWKGVSSQEVERIRESGSDDLILRVAGTTDTLTLSGWFADPANQIEQIVCDDGNMWEPWAASVLWRIGGPGDDFMQGNEYGQALEGRGGNDVLIGGSGNDTYFAGIGHDRVDEYGGGDDEVHFAGVSPDEVSRIRDPGTVSLALRAAGSDNSVLLTLQFSGPTFEVERVIFDDGTVWTLAELADLRYVGTSGSDFLRGTQYDETFEGRGGGDVLDGGGGADTYVFSAADGAGNTALIGAGDRLLLAGLSRSSVVMTRDASNLYITVMDTGASITLQSASGLPGEEGWRTTLEFGDGSVWSPENVVNTSPLVGTNGGEILNGSEFGDQIFALSGNDVVFGKAGNDVLYGGDGLDSLIGDQGDDVLDGGAGSDGLEGRAGSDTYVFTRGSGFDSAWEFLGTAADTDVVVMGADIAPSEITVRYGPATQQFFNDGGFLLSVNGTSDALKIVWSPTTGRDIEIEEVRFADGTVWTEANLVQLAIQNGTAPVLVTAAADQSATEDAPFSFTVPAGAFEDADIFIGDSLAFGATLADGSALPSWLSFDAGTRTFSGTPANGDVGTISVRLTATDESGRSAADEFDFTVTNTNDAPTLASPIADQSARDTVAFSFTLPAGTFADMDAGDAPTYSTSALPGWLSFNPATRTFSGTPGVADIGANVNVEVRATDSGGLWVSDTFAIAVGAAPDRTITGTAGSDTLNGASGNDTINGLGGADSMSGGLGNDAYFVDNSGDQVNEASGGGIDTVNSSITYTLGANVENLTLTGTANRNATGNALDNVLAGNSGSNTLTGLAGNDTYIVTQSNDNVVESSGNGTDTVRASISYTLGNNVEKLVLTGSGSINGTGNSLANSLTGNAGNNTLRGQGGADFLSGGAGNDILTGGSGTDEFYFGEAPGTGGVDHITDFSSGERLQFEEFVFTGLGAPGNFAPNDARFFAAPGASGGADASDRVVYNTTNGHLYYDADGSGAGAATLIAILDNEFLLSATNIGVL